MQSEITIPPGSNERVAAAIENGALAQLVEHLHGMQGVSGSNPLCSTFSKSGKRASLDSTPLNPWGDSLSAHESTISCLTFISLAVNVNEYPDGKQTNNERRTTVTDERKGQSGVWKN